MYLLRYYLLKYIYDGLDVRPTKGHARKLYSNQIKLWKISQTVSPKAPNITLVYNENEIYKLSKSIPHHLQYNLRFFCIKKNKLSEIAI